RPGDARHRAPRRAGGMTMRVLVADDHSLFRDGLVSLLEAAGHQVVGQVGDGQAAVEAARRLDPELILLDVSMPNLDGLAALRQIKAERPHAKVVMLTVSDDDTLFEALEAGAQGYLLKSLSADEFLEILKGVARGEAALTRKTATRLIDGLAKGKRRTEEPQHRLTPRESALLELVVSGMTNKAIAQEMSISENTVKYYMKSILQKLGARNRTEASTLALREGLISQE
ncbi:MAG TPA: response regulator transcription factor, partial [Anaerolineales bacterium]|nr:response regulator transcription factor [Anaerolineales bacterium]